VTELLSIYISTGKQEILKTSNYIIVLGVVKLGWFTVSDN